MASLRGPLIPKRRPMDIHWVKEANANSRLGYLFGIATVATAWYCCVKEERFDWWSLDPWHPARRKKTSKWPSGGIFWGWGGNALNRDCALLEWYCWRGYWGNEWGD
eukprot:TRINITY_DN267_c0_g1_i1.p2 TRINITY_DN267_c0_g1~~TRINITY_DN267_c0_g1_i1.p2  ORF type:complete len:107 (+),score=22.88 TRINITY_DN267_c0_g1_i1:127-447(+)